MMVLDVDSFLQDLAVQPSDTVTRRVYSDALRDLGREAEADRQLAIAAAIEAIPEPYQGLCAHILHRGDWLTAARNGYRSVPNNSWLTEVFCAEVFNRSSNCYVIVAAADLPAGYTYASTDTGVIWAYGDISRSRTGVSWGYRDRCYWIEEVHHAC